MKCILKTFHDVKCPLCEINYHILYMHYSISIARPCLLHFAQNAPFRQILESKKKACRMCDKLFLVIAPFL